MQLRPYNNDVDGVTNFGMVTGMIRNIIDKIMLAKLAEHGKKNIFKYEASLFYSYIKQKQIKI